jgi:hypothetical protein
MAIDDLQHVLERARQHQAFLRTLLRWPEQALAGYPLTRAEIGAIVERDGERLIRLGIETSLARWSRKMPRRSRRARATRPEPGTVPARRRWQNAAEATFSPARHCQVWSRPALLERLTAWQLNTHDRAATLRRLDRHAAALRLRALFHAQQAKAALTAGEAALRRDAAAVIGDRQ